MNQPTNLSRESITELIQLLTKRKAIEQEALKSQWRHSLDFLKLGNIVQESMNLLSPSKPMTAPNNSFVKNIIGLSTGFLINKIYPNKPTGIIAKISKLSFEIIAGKLIANNSDKILSVGSYLIKKIISKK
jgi:hypothetical protein